MKRTIFIVVSLSACLMSACSRDIARSDTGVAAAPVERGDWSHRTLDEVIVAANQGDGEACLDLWKRYRYGNGVPKDAEQATTWCHRAAERGVAQAQVMLGVMYLRGSGVEQDEARALQWHLAAAEQGHATALNYLAEIYTQGLGVDIDLEEAAAWRKKAAEQGSVVAQYLLGELYLEGRGLPQDSAAAYRCFSVAAAQGYDKAVQAQEKVGAELSEAVKGEILRELESIRQTEAVPGDAAE